MNKLYVMGFALLVLASFGCGTSQNSTNGTTYAANGHGYTVQVMEDEYHIHMPTSFPAGNETFHIMNMGSKSHNFKISGNEITQELSQEVAAGQSADLTVALTPGTYHVLCPVLGHADLGMRLDVTVTQR